MPVLRIFILLILRKTFSFDILVSSFPRIYILSFLTFFNTNRKDLDNDGFLEEKIFLKSIDIRFKCFLYIQRKMAFTHEFQKIISNIVVV